MGTDIGGKIKGAVFALVAGIVILYLVPVNFQAADALNRQFYPHCVIGGESSRLVTITGGVKVSATADFPDSVVGRVVRIQPKTGGGCELPSQHTSLATWTGAAGSRGIGDETVFETENGQEFKALVYSANEVGWDTVDIGTAYGNPVTWVIPGEVMTRFQGINRLVTAILPVLITVGLFAVVGFGAAKMWKGGDMGQSIGVEVGIVIVVVVVMNLAPSMFEAIIEGSKGNAGQYGVTSQFSGITDLLFGLLPLLVVLSLIGLLAWRTYSGYKSMSGNRTMRM